MNTRQYVPNTITAMNLVSGMISVTETMNGNFVKASLFIFIAAVFDFFDGSAARWLNVRSEMGKQLDSLADVVSFGVAPGLIMYSLLRVNCEGGCNLLEKLHIIPYFAMLIPVCAAIRLAKFNIDTRQEVNFIGLPTPANAIFFASIPLILFLPSNALVSLKFMPDLMGSTRVLGILTVFFSYLMVSDFRIFSMKMKSISWKENQERYILLILSVLLIILFSFQAIPLIIGSYLLLSLIFQKKMA
ncbi:MAG: CDP-diacylglycerol--serine O-phosphatidyltransferase [Syntrophothermus sp.]